MAPMLPSISARISARSKSMHLGVLAVHVHGLEPSDQLAHQRLGVGQAEQRLFGDRGRPRPAVPHALLGCAPGGVWHAHHFPRLGSGTSGRPCLPWRSERLRSRSSSHSPDPTSVTEQHDASSDRIITNSILLPLLSSVAGPVPGVGPWSVLSRPCYTTQHTSVVGTSSNPASGAPWRTRGCTPPRSGSARQERHGASVRVSGSAWAS